MVASAARGRRRGGSTQPATGATAARVARRPRLRRVKWAQVVWPDRPVVVPHLEGTALRLTLAARLASRASGASNEAELHISVSPSGAAAGAAGAAASRSLSLTRLGALTATGEAVSDDPPESSDPPPCTTATPSGCLPTTVRLKAMINCAEGAVLSATGGPVWVTGRLEGAVPLGWGSKFAKAVEDAVVEPQASRMPRNEKEYLERIEAHLRKHGRTPLRELHNFVPRPNCCPPGTLKVRLLQNRGAFIVDLQDCVDINHSKRWKWSSQAIVTRTRNTVGERGWVK
eukprot:TRINITY_DN20478_c0_g1_i2.p1 TRINITY_DN20478_c0_g1~~TRINITY_DN20478_c0_g1_i2.p1  ORF type:complete len:320 (-),score=26.99 TRINITY_DN20478_c0_g1_i2:61-921(-)